MYRNVLVPVDGSSFSREALLQGVRIAERCGAAVHLVRVGTSDSLVSSPETPALNANAFKDHRAHELSELYQIANECRGNCTAEIVVSILDGPVSDALVGYIARKRIDLVVMRSHARHGLARAWFGSVADNLIRDTGVPVLIVKPPSLATGLHNGFQFKRILVPLDGSALAEQSLDCAIELARVDSATITLLRVVPSVPGPTHELQSSVGPASHAAVTEAQAYLDAIVSVLSEPNVEMVPKVIIADNVAQAILQTSQSHEIDMIAIATHGRGAIARAAAGSVADQLMRTSAISTMVVRPHSHLKSTNSATRVSTQRTHSLSGEPAPAFH